MKKAVSLLASFTLAFSLLGAPVMGFADEENAEASTEDVAAVAEGSETADGYYLGRDRDEALSQQLELLEQTTFYAADPSSDTGSVEVRLTMRSASPSSMDGLQAILIKGDSPATQQRVASASFERKTTDELDDAAGTARIEGVAVGNYILRVQGTGFVTYSQPIEVSAGDRSVIALVDRFAVAEDGKDSVDVTAGRGLLRYGDLDGSGDIDGIDALMMLQTIARVRTGEALSDEDQAKFGMGLVREAVEGTERGSISDSGIPDPQQLVTPEVLDTESGTAEVNNDIKVIYDAADGVEDETKTAPEAGVDLADETPEDAGEVSAPSADADGNAAVAGITEKVTTTEAMPVGLNAFQMLASMRNNSAAAATVRSTKETSHMQAAVAAGSELLLEAGQTIAEVLFNDNGETVKMKLADETKPISETDPVQLTINANDTTMGAITVAVPNDSPNAPTAGQVIVETSDGLFRYYDFAASDVSGQTAALFDLRSNLFASLAESRVSYFDSGTPGSAKMNPVGDLITVDLGGQIPVKTITIKVTATSSNKLAEIAQVEFLNGMEDKIPEPELDIPTNLAASTASKTINLDWAQQRNVTGYEVEISLNGSAKVIGTTKNSIKITSFNGKELVNYNTYTLRARSANGDWRSPWSAPVTATPEANGKPMAPAAPSVKGNYDSITVSWKKAEDAKTHKVYYKKHGESYGAGIEMKEDQTSVTIPGLELKTTYDVVVTGVNAYGEGPRSPEASATTTPNSVKVPWYKLINREVMNKTLGRNYPNPIEAVQADYDKGGDPLNMVDGSYDTYLSGAKGGYYHGGTVTFKEPHDMDTIVLTGYQGQSLNIYDMVVHAWDASGKEIRPNGKAIGFSVTTLNSATRTVMIRTSKLEGVKKVRVAYQRSVGNAWSASTIAELAFYDTTLYSDVMALWADAEHTVLRDGVTMADIDALRTEANTPDPETVTAENPAGEYHPSRNLILAELDNAEAVCKNQGLRAPMKVDPKLNVNGKQAKTGVGGLNGWQPTGVAVEAGDEIAIYVGKKGETSRTVPLAFYVVQNHPEISNGFITRLLPGDGSGVKVGINTFVVPENLTSVNMERGGNLYVVYDTAANSTDQYTVRVSGGSAVPVLDVHGLSGDARTNAVKAYVQELSTYDPQAEHNKKAAAGGHNTHTDSSAYDSQNCIANATDIVMNDMMYSIPVSAVQGALGVKKGADLDAAAQKLTSSVEAMEDMMKLFYQHKGFVKNAADAAKAGYGANNAWPTLRQNIRYVRCSGKVFMYAAGNHVGIQWGSTSGVVSSPGVAFDAAGKYLNGHYFGWGVAHEIGHEINNGAYTYAEVTNNYYSQLAQATDDVANPKTRWGTYDGIYKQVASGAKGVVGGKTGIAMYWQLHLAYDDGYNYKTYDNAADMYSNLIFARMDAYCRNTSAAPQAAENGRPLTMNGANKDNAIMRLACAATQKNLLDFFEAWGLTPDAETKAYAEQWPVETRAIQYQTDALRLYRIGDFSQLGQYGLTAKQGDGAAQNARVTASLVYTPSVDGRPNTTADQTIKVQLTNASTDKEILGYEVLRNGTVVGFLRANDFEGCPSAFQGGTAIFSDTINTVNNRVFKYEVRAVDKLLARGELVSAGEVKVSHKNSLDKTKWTATTNMTSESILPNETHTVTVGTGDNAIVYDAEEYATEDDATANHPVAKAIDNSMATTFSGALPAGSEENSARVTINFNETLTVVGLQAYGAPLGAAYEVQTSPDGESWKTVKTGVFDGADAIYFERADDQYLYGHDATALRVVLPGQTSFSVSEINVLGPEGDDAEFLENGIGLLDKTENLGTGESGKEATIPAGSLVFVGKYTGNPAFNALLLYDQNGQILGGVGDDGAIHAKEVIFAPPVADGAKLGDVKEGYWVYYIEPQYLPADLQSRITSVKAELYRVDNAHTLEGQRLVADTLSVPLPGDLSKIDLSFGQVKTAQLQEPAAQAGQDMPLMDVPIQNPAADAATTSDINGYSYDLADLYGTAPGANADQGDALATPLYGGAIDQNTFADSPLYGSAAGSATETLIVDNATPLGSLHQDDDPFARTTLKSWRESLVKALDRVDVAKTVKSLG